MAKKQKVIVLNRTMNFASYVLIQITLFYLAFLIARSLALTVGHLVFAHLPVGGLTFTFSVCLGIVLIRYFPLGQLQRLKQRILLLMGQAKTSLPDLQLNTDRSDEGLIRLAESEIAFKCVKVKQSDFAKLSNYQQEQIFDVIFDFAETNPQGLQMFASTMLSNDALAEREIFIVYPRSEYEKFSLKNRLRRAGLDVQPVSEEAIRRLYFAHLSPSHYREGHALFPVKAENTNDFLGLCIAGFEQQLDHVLIDGKYARTISFDKMPPLAHSGILSGILETDCELTASLHLRYCDQQKTRSKLKTCYRLGIAPIGEMAAPDLMSETMKLITGEHAIVDISIYFTIYADSLSRLKQEVAKVERTMVNLGGTPRTARAQELDALFSSLPILNDKVDFSRRLNSNAATSFFLFT